LKEGGADDERNHEKMEPVLEIWNQEFQKSAEKSRDIPLIQALFPACFDQVMKKAIRFKTAWPFFMNPIRNIVGSPRHSKRLRMQGAPQDGPRGLVPKGHKQR